MRNEGKAVAYLKRKFGRRAKRNPSAFLRQNKVEKSLSAYTPSKHAERMIELAQDMVNNVSLSPYLIYYLSNVYGEDDPYLSRKTIMDNLQIPTNLDKFDRWEMATILLNNATTAKDRKAWFPKIREFLAMSTPDCKTLRACILGCEIPYPNFIPLPTESYAMRPNYFASGSNKPGEIRGFAKSGIHVGVAADKMMGQTQDQKDRRKALKEMKNRKAVDGSPLKVFIDSGAFGEVGFDSRTKRFKDKPKKEMTHEKWLKVFDLYNEIGNVLGEQAYLVAPDKVGDQAESWRRIKKYMPLLKAKNVNIIVPIPPVGKMIDYDKQVRQFFGNDFIRGIPTVQTSGGAKPAQIKKFVEDLYADPSVPKPLRIHLLGMGLLPKGRAKQSIWEKTIRPALEKIDPMMEVYLDSVRMAAIASRGGTDAITRTQKQALQKFDVLEDNLSSKQIDDLYKKIGTDEKVKRFFEKEWRKKWQPFARRKETLRTEILAASLDGNDEFVVAGESYGIPSFYDFWDFPDVWLTDDQKKEILEALIIKFPEDSYGDDDEEDFQYVGMNPENIALFKKSPAKFIAKYYLPEDGDILKYQDLFAFLYGDAFLFLETHRFLDPNKGILMRAFSEHTIDNLAQEINEGILLSLPPKVKGITLKNSRIEKMNYRRRRNSKKQAPLTKKTKTFMYPMGDEIETGKVVYWSGQGDWILSEVVEKGKKVKRVTHYPTGVAGYGQGNVTQLKHVVDILNEYFSDGKSYDIGDVRSLANSKMIKDVQRYFSDYIDKEGKPQDFIFDFADNDGRPVFVDVYRLQTKREREDREDMQSRYRQSLVTLPKIRSKSHATWKDLFSFGSKVSSYLESPYLLAPNYDVDELHWYATDGNAIIRYIVSFEKGIISEGSITKSTQNALLDELKREMKDGLYLPTKSYYQEVLKNKKKVKNSTKISKKEKVEMLELIEEDLKMMSTFYQTTKAGNASFNTKGLNGSAILNYSFLKWWLSRKGKWNSTPPDGRRVLGSFEADRSAKGGAFDVEINPALLKQIYDSAYKIVSQAAPHIKSTGKDSFAGSDLFELTPKSENIGNTFMLHFNAAFYFSAGENHYAGVNQFIEVEVPSETLTDYSLPTRRKDRKEDVGGIPSQTMNAEYLFKLLSVFSQKEVVIKFDLTNDLGLIVFENKYSSVEPNIMVAAMPMRMDFGAASKTRDLVKIEDLIPRSSIGKAQLAASQKKSLSELDFREMRWGGNQYEVSELKALWHRYEEKPPQNCVVWIAKEIIKYSFKDKDYEYQKVKVYSVSRNGKTKVKERFEKELIDFGKFDLELLVEFNSRNNALNLQNAYYFAAEWLLFNCPRDRSLIKGIKESAPTKTGSPKAPQPKAKEKEIKEVIDESIPKKDQKGVKVKPEDKSTGVNYGDIFDQLKGGMIVEVAMKGYAHGLGTGGKYHRFKLGRKSTSKKYNTEKFPLLREDGKKTAHSIYRFMDKPDAIQAATGDMAMDFIGLRLVDDKKKEKEDRIIVQEEKEEGSEFRSYVALVTYMEDQITDAGYKLVGEPRYSSEGSKYTGIIVQFGKGAYLFGFMARNGEPYTDNPPELTFQYSHKKVVKEDITVPFSTLTEAKKLVRDFLSCIPQVIGEIKSKATPSAPPQPSEKTLKIVKEVGEYAVAQFKSKLNAKFYQAPLSQTDFGFMVSQRYETPQEYKLPYAWDFVIEKFDKDAPIKLRIFSDKSALDLVEKKPLKIIVEIKTAAQGKKAIDNFILCVQDRVEKKPVSKPTTKPITETVITWETLKPTDFKRHKDFDSNGLYYAKIEGGNYYIFKDTDGIKAWYLQRSITGNDQRFSMATSKKDAIADLKKKFLKEKAAPKKEPVLQHFEWGDVTGDAINQKVSKYLKTKKIKTLKAIELIARMLATKAPPTGKGYEKMYFYVLMDDGGRYQQRWDLQEKDQKKIPISYLKTYSDKVRSASLTKADESIVNKVGELLDLDLYVEPTTKPKPKPKAKPKKRRSYSRKPKTHVVIWDGKKTTVKTDRASNVWATYTDDENYDMVTHLPSGFDVFEAGYLSEARKVMTELGKKFKNWKIDLDLGVKPSKEEIKTIRKFLEQYE